MWENRAINYYQFLNEITLKIVGKQKQNEQMKT